ncbi:MAG TPA: peptidylprolyl isomerase [Burkholderiaceae bacterium]
MTISIPSIPSFLRSGLAVALISTLAACGGGGGSSGGDTDPTTPTMPAANPHPTTTTTTCSTAGTAAAAASTATNVVCMLTSDGEIVVELYGDKAPATVTNFMKYVDAGFFTSTIFHRVVPSFVVQGGGDSANFVAKTALYAPIALETNVGLSNVRGTIAMARTSDFNSATSQFYFNTVNNDATSASNLDYINAASPGYAVFGKIISGLSTIDAINAEAQFGTGNDTPATQVMLYWALRLK